MKIGIIIFYYINQISNQNICIQFFFDFSDQCFLWCLSFLYLATWKFPATCKFSISSFLSFFCLWITAATTFIVFISYTPCSVFSIHFFYLIIMLYYLMHLYMGNENISVLTNSQNRFIATRLLSSV